MKQMYKTSLPYYFTRIIFSLSFCFVITHAKAQTVLCPPNIDFENGDFTNWVCRYGTVANTGGVNTVTWAGTGQQNGIHTIIAASNAGLDTYGLFPQSCPNGSGYSVKLGNSGTGRQAEGIFYTYTIPADATTFSLLYNYAIVLQNPGHTDPEQPRFRARIIDMSTGREINCVSFDFTASGSIPGFRQSPVAADVVYKDWTPITIDLSSYAGKTISLEFITSDCTRGGHFGYAYIDVNANCSGTISGSTVCQGDTSILLTAPYGFQSYQWFDNTFSNVLGSEQVLPMNPPPAFGSIFPVIVTPYPGYGCGDTLYATITSGGIKPVSNAGPDKSTCLSQPVQIGDAATPGYAYSWMPSNLLNSPTLPNPSTTNNITAPVSFIVKTTDIQSGCFSYDTTIVSPKFVDTAMLVTGKTNYCTGETINTIFTIHNTAATVQWYLDNAAITGATNSSYFPVAIGSYQAELTENGCTALSSKQKLTISPVPQANFTIDNDAQCINTPVAFTNASTITGNESLMYLWKFSGGGLIQATNAIKSFTAAGNQTVKLVATSSNNCSDSMEKVVNIMPNGTPYFVWDSICTNRPTQLRNLSNENGAAKVTYHWDFNNGITSDLKNPPFINYTTAGKYDVSLQITTTGCEKYPQTVIKKIQVNKTTTGIRYHNKLVTEGESAFIAARDTAGNIFNWKPQVQLNNYTVKNPLFTGVNDVLYLVDITDIHTCFTTDTMQVYILKQPGIYLPTAFTPNGDGLNDVIRPYIIGMKSLKRFSIYNRAGNLIFYTTTKGEGWDGTFKGQKEASGVFVWLLEYVTTDDKTLVKKGTLTLIR